MRYVFYEINNVFQFKENKVNTLVIENRPLFSRLIKDIYFSINGNDGKSVLSSDYTPIPMSKNAELITNFIDFDINTKPIISKIISALEKISVDETNYAQTQMLMGEIENTINKWSFELPCDVVPTKVTPSTILKAAGLEIRDTYKPPFGEGEKILDYMELVREFEKDKLFITVNMRSFFDDAFMETFMNSVLVHQYKVLMIENKAYDKLNSEKRFTIDEDLCEF